MFRNTTHAGTTLIGTFIVSVTVAAGFKTGEELANQYITPSVWDGSRWLEPLRAGETEVAGDE